MYESGKNLRTNLDLFTYLHSNKVLVFKTVTECVYFAVRVKLLNIIWHTQQLYYNIM